MKSYRNNNSISGGGRIKTSTAEKTRRSPPDILFFVYSQFSYRNNN